MIEFLDRRSPADKVAFISFPPPGETVDFTNDHSKIRHAMTRVTGVQARHRGRLLHGRLTLGIIPSLAPYVLPRILPPLQERYPELHLELRETQTKGLIEELVRGTLDVVMLALPVSEAEVETIRLFDDPFLFAVPADDPRPKTFRVSAHDIDPQRLILLEEGHCLRDQALAYCADSRRDRGGIGSGSPVRAFG